jgi:hypothetical protein
MLGILFKSSWSFSPKEQNTDMYTDTKKWCKFHDYYLLAFVFISRRFPVLITGLAIGIAIHHLPIYYFDYFFINSSLDKKAIFSLYLCRNDLLGTFLSDYLPILKVYYTEITAIVIEYYFTFPSTIFRKQRRDTSSILPRFLWLW